jgi:dynein light intermediate chain 2
VKETATKRVAELQATNVNQLNEIRERLTAPYKGHPDEARVRPLDVTVCIVANKHDMFKSLPSADRRNVIQVLRFVAHFFGAHLITTSTSEAAQREAYRGLITSLAFGAAVKPTLETNPDKLVYITRGMDSFQKIFLEHAGEGDALRGKVIVLPNSRLRFYP